MFFTLNNENLNDFIKENWYDSNIKSALKKYQDLVESGRKVKARIYRYTNGDEQLRIYEYTKVGYKYVLIDKINID